MKHNHNQARGTEDEHDGILLLAVTSSLGLSIFNFISEMASHRIDISHTPQSRS
jgi:hypothetical protein